MIGLFDSVGGAREDEMSEEMMKLQCEVLHMFGAVMAGSKVSHSAIDLFCSMVVKCCYPNN